MSTNNHKPILTISIPTFNRAELLRNFLPILLEDASQQGDDIEIIVSDNCSTDKTNEVLIELGEKYKFIHHRQAESIGVKNVIFAADNLAKGEFCWIIGDDDIVPPGTIRRILNLVNENPDIDYFFLPSAHFFIPEIKHLLGGNALHNSIKPHIKTPKLLTKEGRREKLIDLINPEIRRDYLGFIGNSVFRRSYWAEVDKSYILDDFFSEWKSAFPHVHTFATNFLDRPAYYCQEHFLLEGANAREWESQYQLVLYLSHLEMMMECFHSRGLSNENYALCKKSHAGFTGNYFLTYISRRFIKKTLSKSEGEINLVKLLKYIRYKEFWKSMSPHLRDAIRHRIAKAVK